MKYVLAAAIVLLVLAGCSAGTPAATTSTSATPTGLTPQEYTALGKVADAALQTDDVARQIRKAVSSNSDAAMTRHLSIAADLLSEVDPYATDDAHAFDSGTLDPLVKAYEVFYAAVRSYDTAASKLYLGMATPEDVAQAQNAVDDARRDYLASVKSLLH